MNIRLRLEEIIDSLDNNSVTYEEGINQLMSIVRKSLMDYEAYIRKEGGSDKDNSRVYYMVDNFLSPHNLPEEKNEPFTKCPRCESESVITYTCDHINCKECKCNFQYGFRNEKQK